MKDTIGGVFENILNRPVKPAASTVRAFAPAKLTLSLRITGVRSDGYHLIDAEMTTLDFGDWLEITSADAGVHMLTTAATVTEHVASCDNLITKALTLASRKAGVKVYKNIPFGSGLGGGSTNAAALLRWAGFTDVESSASIGADVAFCLVGGRARVKGIGELVESVPYSYEHFTLLTPPISCSTPAVYQAWDELGGPEGANGNDLEPAALHVFPELERWRDELGNATGVIPRLAGSGSTWFVPGMYPGFGYTVVATRPAETV